jgi:acyl-coenzyme A synthetase/AMP-(fatty) acid ligase
VKECTVIGIAAELEGELPTAVVVVKSGATVTEEELVEFVNTRVADHKKLRYERWKKIRIAQFSCCFIFRISFFGVW